MISHTKRHFVRLLSTRIPTARIGCVAVSLGLLVAQQLPVPKPIGQPVITQAVDAATEIFSGDDVFAPGSVVVISGSRLATGSITAPANWQVGLGGARARLITSQFAAPNTGVSLPVGMADPKELRVQIPYGIAPGTYLLDTGSPIRRHQVQIETASPSLPIASGDRVRLRDSSGKWNSDNSPVRGGTIATLEAAGLGVVTPALTAGVVTPPAPRFAASKSNITIEIGAVSGITTNSIALKPGSVGIYEMEFRVPNFEYGRYELRVVSNGRTSNSGYVTIYPGADPREARIDDPCAVMPMDGRAGSSAPIPPPGTSSADIDILPEEETTELLNNRFADVDTSTDAWLASAKSPCDLNLGGDLPAPQGLPTPAEMPNIQNVANYLQSIGPDIARLTAEVNPVLPPIVPANFVYQPQPDLCPAQKAAPPPVQKYCTALAESPFAGKDIIYVHGLSFSQVLRAALGPNVTTFFPNADSALGPIFKWPGDADAFFENTSTPPPLGSFARRYAQAQYWHQARASHVANFLGTLGRNRRAQNRFIMVGWSNHQRLEYATHTILTQIVRAMTTPTSPEIKCMDGNTVVTCAVSPNPVVKARGGSAFCARGCVIISHSTGSIVTDVAMAMAKDASFQGRYGPLQFVPDRMTVHVAAGGAFNGSQYATAALAVVLGASNAIANYTYGNEICTIANLFLSGGNGQLKYGCQFDNRLMDSILPDLNPWRIMVKWAPWIRRSPVPTLTVAGASYESMNPLKYFLQRAYDDGVVAMDSACGRDVRVAQWPTGFRAPFGIVDPRVFDMGLTKDPGFSLADSLGLYAEKNLEWLLSPPPFNLPPFYRAAAACTPYKSPQGMIERVRDLRLRVPGENTHGPLNYYPMHFPFIQTSENHGAAARFWSKRDELIGRQRPEYPDVKAILTSSTYQYVKPSIGDGEALMVRGKAVRIFKKRKVYIWKRSYIRLANYADRSAMDYAYDFVR